MKLMIYFVLLFFLPLSWSSFAWHSEKSIQDHFSNCLEQMARNGDYHNTKSYLRKLLRDPDIGFEISNNSKREVYFVLYHFCKENPTFHLERSNHKSDFLYVSQSTIKKLEVKIPVHMCASEFNCFAQKELHIDPQDKIENFKKFITKLSKDKRLHDKITQFMVQTDCVSHDVESEILKILNHIHPQKGIAIKTGKCPF